MPKYSVYVLWGSAYEFYAFAYSEGAAMRFGKDTGRPYQINKQHTTSQGEQNETD